MQAPKMTYLCIYNYINDISKGGRMCSPWTWLGQEWPLWQIWIDFGQSGDMMAWRISPRWVWEILFSFDFTTFVSGWDVQPWRRLLVLRSQHGVPRRRRWCWGDPDGLSQPHFVHLVWMVRMVPLNFPLCNVFNLASWQCHDKRQSVLMSESILCLVLLTLNLDLLDHFIGLVSLSGKL